MWVSEWVSGWVGGLGWGECVFQKCQNAKVPKCDRQQRKDKNLGEVVLEKGEKGRKEREGTQAFAGGRL